MAGAEDVEMAGGVEDEVPQVKKDFEAAKEIEAKNPDQAKAVYTQIIKSDQDSDEGMKTQELAVYQLGKLHVKNNDAAALVQFALHLIVDNIAGKTSFS